VVELGAFMGLLLFIANQYLEPAVSNAMKPLSQSDWWRVLERVLKLALPNLYAWLVSAHRAGGRDWTCSGGGPGRGAKE
jgi:diacylglycerol O-acyltransferase-1